MGQDDKHLHFEEEYFGSDRKESRLERKLARAKDRSKHKKTDQKQQKKVAAPKGPHLKRGRVIAIVPDGYYVSIEETPVLSTLKGSLKKEKTKYKNLVAVGDFVLVDQKEQGLGQIVYIEERTSYLSRADNISRRKEQLIAVNIDQVFIVVSVVSPKLKPALVDRYIIAALKGRMKPIIVVNKLDLLENPPIEVEKEFVAKEKILLEIFTKAYEPLGISVIQMSAENGQGFAELNIHMKDKTSVFSGQSGVGKSSILNAVIGTSLRTRDVVAKTQKGAHTTSVAHLIPLDCGGFCIDTPGIKSFGLWDLQQEEIKDFFPEFEPFRRDCKFPNCTHLHEPECGVQKAVESGELSELRYASYQTLYENPILKEWE
ncbi:MAG: ribosome small subunit-dependent GTPase A [Simkaniaceae bacterium]|nr:ribosome small subunit-dependent GTPase A [Simkaniaceae bacterium]